MNWVYSLVAYFIGMFVFSFTVIVAIIILAFGIPTTKKLEKLNLIKPNHSIIKRYLISLILLIAIFSGTFWLVMFYFPNQLAAFLIGCAVSFLFGIGKTGRNMNNILDYVETNTNALLVQPEKVIEAILTR